MKLFILLGPAYINFVIGHICGLDIFCPKAFRDSFDLIRNTDKLEYQEEMLSLITESLACRTNLGKVGVPTIIAIYLLLNLCIMVKELSRILPPFQVEASSAPEALELRTVSAIVDNTEASEDEQPQNSDHAESYSVGVMTGVLTILAITLGLVFSLIILHKASDLMFLMVEMIIRILIPLVWLVRNNAIIKTTFS